MEDLSHLIYFDELSQVVSITTQKQDGLGVVLGSASLEDIEKVHIPFLVQSLLRHSGYFPEHVQIKRLDQSTST